MNLKLLLLLLLFPAFSWAQIVISGTVVAKNDNAPLAGVTIIEKDTRNGTSTDYDGRFTITVANNNSILRFSFVGFCIKEVKIKDETQMLVAMKEDCNIDWFDGQQIGLYLNSGVIHTPIGGQFNFTFPSFLDGPLLKSGISYQTNLKDNRFMNVNLDLEHLLATCGFNADVNSSYRTLDFEKNITLTAYSIETNLNLNNIKYIIGYSTIDFANINQNKTINSSGLTVGVGTYFNNLLFDSATAKATLYNGLTEYHASLNMRHKGLYGFLKFYKVNTFNEVSIGIGTKLWYRLKQK